MIIYKITNKKNGKIYIGQTIRDLEVRFKQHCRSGCYLYKAIKKYGVESFDKEIIDTATTREELDEKETYWIKKLNSIYPNGYNLTYGGIHYEVSEETREKHKQYRGEKSACFGKPLSEEHKKKLSIAFSGKNNPFYGKKHTKETVEHLRKINLDKVVSEEVKQKISEKTKGENNPFYGKTHTEETRQKISEIRKNYVGAKHPRAKSIICLETGVIYDYIEQAKEFCCDGGSHIGDCCNGKLKSSGGYHWAYVDDVDCRQGQLFDLRDFNGSSRK